jgi:glycosyltransferase involved in cell wall biosynthesis
MTSSVVLISHSREVGGAEVHLERLIRDLVPKLGQIELVCRPDPVLDEWCRRIEQAGARVHRLALTNPSGFLRLRRILGRSRLVHLHLAHPVGKYQLVAALAAGVMRRPAIITHHLALQPAELGVRGWQRWAWSRGLRMYRRLAARHIVISQYAKSLLTTQYGYDSQRLVVIYNGTDTDLFKPQPEGQAGGKTPLVLTVARLTPQKGLMDLVDAARTLLRDLPDTRFAVIGDGALRSTLEAAVAASQLDGHFEFLGARTPQDIADWLRAADVFVLPSHVEGGPAMALMEAMASGCAVIATRVSGTDELVDESTGCLVPPQQPPALAQAMVHLLNDPAGRAELGRRARERVVERFTLAASLAKTLELYRSML